MTHPSMEELREELKDLALVAVRMANDSGIRRSLAEVAEMLGIDLEES